MLARCGDHGYYYIRTFLSHSGEMSRCIGGRRLLEVMEKLKVYGDEKLPSGSLLTI